VPELDLVYLHLTMQIKYTIENELDVSEFREVLIASTLGERRPVDDMKRLSAMLAHANLIVTARDGGKLVGVARSVTDFVYCTYLSDLAVHVDYQKRGIGTELIRATKLASPDALLILLSAPKAVDYYPKTGMLKHEHCFILRDVNDLK
jgi:predicted N-acetyltransferase YhbS